MKRLFSHNGSAILMALLGVVVFSALVLMTMHRTKINQRLSMQAAGDNEIQAAVLNVTAHLLTPKNCNATFEGRSIPPPEGSLSPSVFAVGEGIMECTIGSCSSGTVGRTVKYPLVAAGNTSWLSTVTGFKGMSAGSDASRESSNIRLNQIRYWLYTNQVNAGTIRRPAVLRLQLVFEKRLGTSPETKTSRVLRDILIPVIVFAIDHATGIAAPNLTSKILGCPKTPNSTVIYTTP